jgi:hypothetical protein
MILFIWGFDRSKANVWQFANGSLEGPKYIRDLFNDDQSSSVIYLSDGTNSNNKASHLTWPG